MSILSLLTRAIRTHPVQPAPSAAPVSDPITGTIEKHVKVIDRNTKSISDIELAHHREVGELRAKRAETNRLYQHLLADIDREITRSEELAKRKIAVRQKLIQSSEAALTPLRDTPPEPTSLDRAAIPITRHTDIRS